MPITVVLWDGTEIASQSAAPKARVRIRNRWTLWKLCVNPMFEFGEAYANGELEVEGDLTRLMAIVFFACNHLPGKGIRPAVESGVIAPSVMLEAGGRSRREELAEYERRLLERLSPLGQRTAMHLGAGGLAALFRGPAAGDTMVLAASCFGRLVPASQAVAVACLNSRSGLQSPRCVEFPSSREQT